MYLTQGLHRAVAKHPHKIATVFGDRKTTFLELRDRVARLAFVLRELGLEPGMRIAILAFNSDRYIEYFLASWWSAGVVCPINIRWSVPEIVDALNDSESTLLVVDDAFLPSLSAIRAGVKSLRNVIHMGEAAPPLGMLRSEELISAASPMEDVRPDAVTLSIIVYTGGTTGRSKGVMLSHANVWAPIVSRIAELPAPPECVTLHAAPFFHMAALQRMVYQFVIGGGQVVLSSYDTVEALRSISQHRVNDLMLVPSMLQMMLDHPDFTSYETGSLKRISHGASPIEFALLERALQAFPGVEFSTTYGMTEGGVVTVSLPDNYHGEARANGRIRSVGRVGYGAEIRIVDPQGRDLSTNEVGEVVVKGPGVMMGYWRRPEETQSALKGGWLHTGDGGYLDDEGYLYIADRIKDMIISGGENVYSAEVENVLARHSSIATCAVIAVPSELWGESVHAVLVLKPGCIVSLEEIRAHCRQSLAGYKCPKSLEIRDVLPLSGVGKILKSKLREPYWNGPSGNVSQVNTIVNTKGEEQ